jgi:four helix bundle protein
MSKTLPTDELYGLTSQIRRCAVSIPSNMAEGYMRGTKEYIHFLKIALGSSAELETQLSLCNDLGYLKEKAVIDLLNLNDEVIKLLKTYMQRISIR